MIRRAHHTEPVFAHSTLRARILLFTGIVLILLLLVISQVLLYQWRSVIISKQEESVVAVSKTFMVTVLDALIREDQSASAREGMLQTSIDDFMRSLGNVKYVAIVDDRQRLIAAGPPLLADAIPLTERPRLSSDGLALRITEDSTFSWVIDVHIPLRVARKSWGSAVFGYDASPIRDELRRLFFFLFVTTVIVSGATLIVLYVLASRLTRSLNRLVKEMDNVDLDREVRPSATDSGDDVAFLFQRFDAMQRRIDQSRIQLENAQRQVFQAEKLASIGRLASGVAHQVNNPLHGIRACLYAIEKEPENTGQTREYLGLIGEAIANIEAVVQKLLGFARQQPAQGSMIDISASARKVASLVDVRLREKSVRLALDLPEGLPPVAIDHQLFQEVVMNLLLNSFDAVGQRGTIAVTTGVHGADAVFLAVRDNGVGIQPEDLDRIFEPFYTTKDIGQGTGLGLSVSQSIIEQHGGTLLVQSAMGQGSTFTVILPRGSAE
ncbi:MAG: ATP-binding protein [Bacteroidetes bacterium]|nr:ATP-binding protein [Bacteroidota bacterium]